eukprot:g6701.t1
MSTEGCRTDSICCYRDDSGADDLRGIATGLASALVVSLLALLAATVAWRRASGRASGGKETHPSVADAAANTAAADGGTSPGAAAAGPSDVAAAEAAAAAAAAAGERAPPYSAAVAATTHPTRTPGGGKNSNGGSGVGGEEQRTSTESPEAHRPPLSLAVVEEGRGGGSGGGGGNGGGGGQAHGRGHVIRTPARDHQYRRTGSGVSLRSMKSAGSLNEMQEPPSPSSAVHQDDVQRLRALLDAERSRRVAAENAISNGGASSRRGGAGPGGGSGTCTPTSTTGGTGTPRSRSYSGIHKSAMALAVEAHAFGPTTPKSQRDRSGSAGDGGGAAMGAPSRSFGNLANMVATPRRARLSYSALHKFPSPRIVEAHALEAAENGSKWVQSVVARLGGRAGGGGGGGGVGAEAQRRQSQLERERQLLRAELPSVVSCVLAQLFVNCRAEVNRLLQARVDGLRAFVGGSEPVHLGNPPPPSSVSSTATPGGGRVRGSGWSGSGRGGASNSSGAAAAAGAGDGAMAPDTQELLYGELRRRYRTIAGLGRKELVALTAGVLSHALDAEAKREAGRTLVHQTWPSFEPVVRSYLALFVECALQQPPIEFEDTAGTEVAFDPETHRALAILPPRLSPGATTPRTRRPAPAGLPLESSEEPPDGVVDGEDADLEGRSCRVVFPATFASIARWPPSEAAKSGVIVFAG